MRRILMTAAALVALTGVPAIAQGPAPDGPAASPQTPGPGGQQQPSGPAAARMPGPTTEIVGPEGAFRLQPDGVNWERFQTVRAIGVRCSEKACGGERVFCMIQARSAKDALPGVAPSAASAQAFGDGVLKTAPKELKAEYVAPFAEARFGANPGRWAEVKAEGEPGSLRFGLFLAEAKAHEIAFNCVTPSASWATHKPKIDALLASLQIPR
jgi:hypothetical protein